MIGRHLGDPQAQAPCKLVILSRSHRKTPSLAFSTVTTCVWTVSCSQHRTVRNLKDCPYTTAQTSTYLRDCTQMLPAGWLICLELILCKLFSTVNAALGTLRQGCAFWGCFPAQPAITQHVLGSVLLTPSALVAEAKPLESPGWSINAFQNSSRDHLVSGLTCHLSCSCSWGMQTVQRALIQKLLFDFLDGTMILVLCKHRYQEHRRLLMTSLLAPLDTAAIAN